METKEESAQVTARTIRVVHGRPPNYETVVAAFPEASREGTIFTYGDTAYYTGNKELSRELRAHEAVHANRQLELGVEDWWARYIADQGFRLHEEVLAHRAEYQAYVRRHGPGGRLLQVISERLSGPLYGGLLTIAQAKHAILTGEIQR